MSSRSERFEPVDTDVGRARNFVTSVVASWGFDATDVALAVGELAANAVAHARSPFVVNLALRSEVSGSTVSSRVRLEVSDENPRVPVLGPVALDAYSGRGLMMVEAVSLAFGVVAHPGDGKTLWCELAL